MKHCFQTHFPIPLVAFVALFSGCNPSVLHNVKNNSQPAVVTEEQILQNLGGPDSKSFGVGGNPNNPCADQLIHVSDATVSSSRTAICEAVNISRSENGDNGLTLDAGLSEVAQAYAEDMSNRQFFDHVSPDGQSFTSRLDNAGIRYGTAGENIAMGYTSPDAAMNGWMNSYGHRANILQGAYTKIGIGVYNHYWVQEFSN